MIVVCDTSALINLAKINQLRLLEEMFGGVLIPQGVYDEIVTEGKGRVGTEEVESASYIQVKELENSEDTKLYIDPLSEVDAEVIVFAKEQNADLIITRDRRLRGRAGREEILVYSLVELFIVAKNNGFIQAVKPLLDELRNKGVLIREGIYQETLRQAREV